MLLVLPRLGLPGWREAGGQAVDPAMGVFDLAVEHADARDEQSDMGARGFDSSGGGAHRRPAQRVDHEGGVEAADAMVFEQFGDPGLAQTARRVGVVLPGERKSVEPMAARVEPRRVQGAHQSLHHFGANADWSQEDLLRRVRTFVLPAIEKSGVIGAWIVDDTGFPKKGVHSVGVARQYCGQLGKQDNCQIAVSLSVANEHASLPIAFRLYLPEDWAVDPVRRARASVPEDVVFKTKPQIALDQIKAARAEGVVLADAGYWINTAFRMALTRMGLTYVVGIQSSARLWPPGSGPLKPKTWSGQGRPPTLMRRAQPASIG